MYKTTSGCCSITFRGSKEAHEYLDKARRLTVSLRDKVAIAQIDETRAQVLIAEKNFTEAESIARNVGFQVLEKSGVRVSWPRP